MQLRGLNAEEGATLIAKLEAAQGRLKAGEFQPFELLAGSPASWEMSKVSPRDAFLALPFQRVWDVERVRTDNRHWQPYKLSYAPAAFNGLQWEIEVVLNIEGNIERVTMTFKGQPMF